MIRKLTEQDRAAVMELVMQEPAQNLFIIGDVENFGFETDFQELWGEFDSGDRLIAVLLRYYGNYLPYASGPFDVRGFASLILNDPNAEMLSGIQRVVREFEGLLTFAQLKQTYFAELASMQTNEAAESASDPVRSANRETIDGVFALLDSIEEFRTTASSRNAQLQTIETGTGRMYYAERDGRVAATASTAAENSRSAMVVGVATHADYRGQGFATLVTRQLCRDLLSEGKTLCLFYDNPTAGSIYHRMGFRDIGFWSMAYLK